MGEFCPKCGKRNCLIHTNGNGLKAALSTAERVGEIEHERLKTNIDRVDKEVKTFNDKFDAKQKFILLMVIGMVGGLSTFIIAGDQLALTLLEKGDAQLDDKIRNEMNPRINANTEALQNHDIIFNEQGAIMHGNDRLLSAIVSGNVRLTSEIDSEDKFTRQIADLQDQINKLKND